MNNRLKELRKDKDITQAQLAEKSGISRVQLNKIENGKVENIGSKTIAAVCSALGCKPQEFFCD